MSNIIDRAAGGLKAGPGKVRPRSDRSNAIARGQGFTQVPHVMTADLNLSDAAFRAYVGLHKFSWNGRSPTNAQLATACGWVTKDGRPAVSKAKRALRELEERGIVRRNLSNTKGYLVREGIQVGVPEDAATPGSDLTGGWVKSDPGGGSKLTRGGGSNLTPSEDRCRKTGEDSSRRDEEGLSLGERQRPQAEGDGWSDDDALEDREPVERPPAEDEIGPKPQLVAEALPRVQEDIDQARSLAGEPTFYGYTPPPPSDDDQARQVADERRRQLEALNARRWARGGAALPEGPPPTLTIRECLDRFPEADRAELEATMTDPLRREVEGFLARGMVRTAGDRLTRHLTDRRRRPPPDLSAPTAELLEALGWCDDPTIVVRATAALRHDFEDQQYWPAFNQVCEQAWQRRRPAESLVYAHGKAMGPRAKNRGAIFKVELDKWDQQHAAASPIW